MPDTTRAASTPLVTLERGDDGVALVTLRNPKVNALSSALLGQLYEVATELTERPPGAVVVTGGDRIFAAGADIAEFTGPDAAADITEAFHRALDAVASIPRFVIASISGYALGGGCELALACDYRIASERAVFGQPEVLLGIIPGGGGTQRLTRRVGASRAIELMITGRQVRADEAVRIGLVDEVVAAGALDGRVSELAAQVASGALAAHAEIKALVARSATGTLGEGLGAEREAFVRVFRTDDAAHGVQSFRDNGPGRATFRGR